MGFFQTVTWIYIIALLAILLIGTIAYFISSFVADFCLKIIIKKAKDKPINNYLILLKKPIRLLFITCTIHSIAIFFPFISSEAQYYKILIKTMFTVGLFWSLYGMIKPIFHANNNSKIIILTEEVKEFLVKLSETIIIILGCLSVMSLWGIDVGHFLAGLGLFGMAIAFAGQDTIKNFFGCVAILSDQVFRKGDWIKTAEIEGMVETIGFRTTCIRQFDKALVHIPNTKLADAAVINFSKMTFRRVKWIIKLTYNTKSESLEKIVQRIRSFLNAHPDIESDLKKVTTIVNVDSFNDSSIDIFCYFFTKTTKWVNYMDTKEEALLAIKKIVEEEGGAFAFPTSSVYIENPDHIVNEFSSNKKSVKNPGSSST